MLRHLYYFTHVGAPSGEARCALAQPGDAPPRPRRRLELAHVASELSQVTLLGSYHPPLSAVGDVGDRLLGHRVAEAVVRRFVEDVAVRLAGVAADAPE